MRRDTCTTCGGAFKTDRDGLWSGDKREHRCESTCVKHLKERLAAAEEAAQPLSLHAEVTAWRNERDEIKQRLAAAEARVTELTAQLALRLRAEGCDREELLKECIENRNKLAAAEARSMATKYEELRSIIDGGSETMTHEDAVQDLKDRADERDELQRKLDAAEAATNACYREIDELRAAIKTAGIVLQRVETDLVAINVPADECRRLLREACEMPRYCTRFEEWKERAEKAGGGE